MGRRRVSSFAVVSVASLWFCLCLSLALMIISTVVTLTYSVYCSIPTPIVQRQISGAHIVPCCLPTSVWPFVPPRQSIVIEHPCLTPPSKVTSPMPSYAVPV